jgi:hypothetical protein
MTDLSRGEGTKPDEYAQQQIESASRFSNAISVELSTLLAASISTGMVVELISAGTCEESVTSKGSHTRSEAQNASAFVTVKSVGKRP